jgi:hypothetical protein
VNIWPSQRDKPITTSLDYDTIDGLLVRSPSHNVGDRMYRVGEEAVFFTALLHSQGWVLYKAEHLGNELLQRYPACSLSEAYAAAMIVWTVAGTVHDPNDWDAIGTALDVIALWRNLE